MEEEMNNNYLPPKGSVEPNTPAPNVPAATQDWRQALDRAKELNKSMPPAPPSAGGGPLPPLPTGAGAPPMAGGQPNAGPAGPGPVPNMGGGPAGAAMNAPAGPGGGGMPPVGAPGQQIGGVANALRNRREMLGY